MAMTPFTDIQNDTLVELVREHPILWNTTNEKFKSGAKTREDVWKEISLSVNRTAKECKTRWRSIKDHRLRQKRQDENGIRTSRKIATYWRKLDFLDAVDNETIKRECSNVDSGEEEKLPLENEQVYADALEMDCDESSSSSIKEETTQSKKIRKKLRKDGDYLIELFQSKDDGELLFVDDPLAPKRKRIHETHSQNNDNDDEIDLFFKAMAATVKKFSYENKVETKMKVFNVINQIESRALKR